MRTPGSPTKRDRCWQCLGMFKCVSIFTTVYPASVTLRLIITSQTLNTAIMVFYGTGSIVMLSCTKIPSIMAYPAKQRLSQEEFTSLKTSHNKHWQKLKITQWILIPVYTGSLVFSTISFLVSFTNIGLSVGLFPNATLDNTTISGLPLISFYPWKDKQTILLTKQLFANAWYNVLLILLVLCTIGNCISRIAFYNSKIIKECNALYNTFQNDPMKCIDSLYVLFALIAISSNTLHYLPILHSLFSMPLLGINAVVDSMASFIIYYGITTHSIIFALSVLPSSLKTCREGPGPLSKKLTYSCRLLGQASKQGPGQCIIFSLSLIFLWFTLLASIFFQNTYLCEQILGSNISSIQSNKVIVATSTIPCFALVALISMTLFELNQGMLNITSNMEAKSPHKQEENMSPLEEPLHSSSLTAIKP